jgi:hypothetical protein
MKVKELIEVLKNYDQEESVVYWDDEICDYQDIKSTKLKERVVWKNGPDDYVDEYQMSREYYKQKNLKSEKVLIIQES